jgi:hypothetical protein
MRFLSIYLSLSDHQENETRHWKRVGHGGKNPTKCCIGSALCLLSIFVLLLFFCYVLPHVQGKHNGGSLGVMVGTARLLF